MGKEVHRSIRPVLVFTEHTVSHYHILLRYLLAGFAERSIHAALVCPFGHEIEPLLCGSEDVVFYPPVSLPFMDYFGLGYLSRRLSRYQANVIHCFSEDKSVMVRYLAYHLDIPYILHLGITERIGPLSISEKHCARLLVSTTCILEELKRKNSRYADRLTYIPMGTMVSDTCRCFHDPYQCPGLIITYPMEALEDFENVLHALKNLLTEGYEFTVLMMGRGRAEHSIRQYIDTLGLTRVVTIVPELRPWRSVLAGADIFIQPQPTVSFNAWLLEAMSVGMVVAASRRGVEDMIHDGRTAVVFDPDDELSIRTVLRGLLDRREWARQLAQQAQDYLRAHHRVDYMIDGMVHEYEAAGRDY